MGEQETHPATYAPAGSSRGGHGSNETSEALGVKGLNLIFGFTLFTAFALHCHLVRVGKLTRKALGHEVDLALEADLPKDQWFHSG